MKRFISILMGMLMPVLVLAHVLSVPVFASEDETVMMIIKCPEQGFSTLCIPGCSYDYTPDGGVSIQLDDAAGGGRVSIFKTDAPGADFAAETYFENAFIDLVVRSYGDNLLDLGEYTIYPFAGKELPGRMVMFNKDGQTWMRFCLYDLEDDYFVRYETISVLDEEKAQNAVDVMSDAIRYLQPDDMYYYDDEDQEPEPVTESLPEPEPATESLPEPEPEDVAEPIADAAENEGVQVYYIKSSGEESEAGVSVKIISCPAEGFSTKCGIHDEVEYKDSLGVTAFLESDGPTIWVRVHRLDFDPDFDTEAYFRDEVDPSMQYIYKDNEYGEGEFTSFQSPYKYVEGKEYQYSIGGYDYTRRVMIYKNDSDIVRFEMAYTDDTFNRVQWDLNSVITCYEPDPDCYQSSYSGYEESTPSIEFAPFHIGS